ncbi:MAG: hypothetical protein R2708_05025 [Vicinamibacterales bacterium]
MGAQRRRHRRLRAGDGAPHPSHLGTFQPQRQGAARPPAPLAREPGAPVPHAARHPAPDELDDALADAGTSPLDQAIRTEDRERYQAGLKRLRRADRQAIVASIELGYSYDQIALMLDKPSAEAARVAVRRALVRLGEEVRGSRRKVFPDSLAAALADGAAIDWRAIETAAEGAVDAALVRQLRVIAAMRADRRRLPPRGGRGWRLVGALYGSAWRWPPSRWWWRWPAFPRR